MITLIIGLPSTGKTTYAKNHLKDGLCYDFDYLVSAFRLCRPHAERHEGAKRMANDIAWGFYSSAIEYSDNILIIRSAPGIDEVEEMEPDKIVVMLHEYPTSRMMGMTSQRTRLQERIHDVIQWAKDNGVILEYPPGSDC